MKKTLPMLPLRGKYIFPNTVIHFDVSRSRSVKAIEEAMEHDQMIFLNNQIDPTAEDPGIEDLYRVGTLARIKQVVKLPKNILRVFAEGLFRAELSETVEYEPFYKVEVLYDHVEQQSFEEFEREAFLRMIKEAFEEMLLFQIPQMTVVLHDHIKPLLYRMVRTQQFQKALHEIILLQKLSKYSLEALQPV